ncbi:hypothetical protein FHX82_007193 [Amycolatopsis bartoniae]|uniref:Uncharacterized protein n=1 Tax=Amycolatopsis bartoniae TaxID=941986 RepID=A0A8H9J073_9PSEU|nr:hypothetical protein [Amycolatopsis bartoniae]GHF54007.1 hypothetical protein GCM10017566_29360 [Amycolatopsis bartoniae]
MKPTRSRSHRQPWANAAQGRANRDCLRASRPPGRSTRATSASTHPTSGTVHRTSVDTTVSTLPSANGRASADAGTVRSTGRVAARCSSRRYIAGTGSVRTTCPATAG